jgi:hypothetical protein
MGGFYLAVITSKSCNRAAASGRLRFCDGLKTGNYTFAAERVAEKARPAGLDLEVVPTPGAADNLRRLRAGECDIALSQSDIFELRRAADPGGVRGIAPFARAYSEYVHVLCPVASGWTSTAQFRGTKPERSLGWRPHSRLRHRLGPRRPARPGARDRGATKAETSQRVHQGAGPLASPAAIRAPWPEPPALTLPPDATPRRGVPPRP